MYVTGIKVDFDNKDTNRFRLEINGGIEANHLIIALCVAIEKVCKANDFDMKKKINKYFELGSPDNYVKKLDETDKMNEIERLATLLKEFDFDKNGVDECLEMLKYTLNEVEKIYKN